LVLRILDKEKDMKRKAVGLLSGGLDSSLALKIVLDLGFEVVALNLKTPFCLCDSPGSCFSQKVADKFGVPIKRVFAGEDYLEIIKNPKHGYGRNMNPCLDCRIYLFKKAKELMEELGADFIFTGEVLGQRPMSQRKDAMNLIEKESGLKGRILRPLCAKLLTPTIPEKEGIIGREKLLAIQGRSRKKQLGLAQEFFLNEFSCPAGGCLLTDENFSKKLKESFHHNESSLRHIYLLKIGRHFRLPNLSKLIVGRNKEENELLMQLAFPSETKFTVDKYKSSYALLLGEDHKREEEVFLAASICARFSDQKELKELPVRYWKEDKEDYKIIETPLSSEKELSSLRLN
jgi:tRNA U34 2-thiouridine synthase MnmA/TrmU